MRVGSRTREVRDSDSLDVVDEPELVEERRIRIAPICEVTYWKGNAAGHQRSGRVDRARSKEGTHVPAQTTRGERPAEDLPPDAQYATCDVHATPRDEARRPHDQQLPPEPGARLLPSSSRRGGRGRGDADGGADDGELGRKEEGDEWGERGGEEVRHEASDGGGEGEEEDGRDGGEESSDEDVLPFRYSRDEPLFRR